ncbi:M28 family peptidase [Bacillus sp. FJAT-22090]|uniref:M28 family peptidase n=1 Tax=Bacillus sp. FJAT-22090 TaxID=1581038 RepID=UPI0006ADD0A1|nr:M28 family peptidase [Bacillus sp. FJAT-22090]
MRISNNKIILTIILGIATVVPIVAFSPHFASTEFEKMNALETQVLWGIDADNIYNNIRVLSKTPRVAGTAQENEAVAYIKKQFESYGYESEVQSFHFNSYTPPQTLALSVKGYSQRLQPIAFEYSVNGDISGEIVAAGLGKMEDLNKLNLKGKIALIQRGEITFADKISNATAKGAIGVIIYNQESDTINASLGDATKTSVPAVFLTKEEGDDLISHLKKNPGSIGQLNIKGASFNQNTSHNVIAIKKPVKLNNSTNNIIVIGAHHDSVAGAPGANDDASGTAMTLELARVLKNISSDTEIRFVTFGAEELGLLGSSHYVESLSEDEKNRIVANFNLDMVGSKNAGNLILQTIDGKPNLVTDLSQEASEKLNGEPTPFNQGERSDHVSFAEAGIPAALFIHHPTEEWYHTPQDTIDKISKSKLQDVAEIVGLAILNQIVSENQSSK